MERKNFLWAMLIGAAVGELVIGWLGPKLILWYFDPPVHTGCTCTEAVGWALARLQMTQLVGLGVGAILGALILGLMRRRRARPVNPY